MNNEVKSKLSRRNFLLAAGAGGAAAAAAIASKTLMPASEGVAAGDQRGKGYRETAHVRSYYNTAKV